MYVLFHIVFSTIKGIQHSLTCKYADDVWHNWVFNTTRHYSCY